MVLVSWSSAISVDIEIIDEQHKKLLKYINTLYDALLQKKENEILMKLFHDLEKYAKTHFALEEKLFKKFDYKDKENHILEHKKFTKKLAQMKKQIPKDLMDAEDLLTFLIDWLINHLKKSDHKYITCFHKHGLY